MESHAMKFFFVLFVGLVWLTTSPVQGQGEGDALGLTKQAEDVVLLFKSYIDAANIDGMLSLYGAKNQKEPLNPKNYDKMRPVMQRYVNAWQGVPFLYGEESDVMEGAQVIFVASKPTDDLLKFYVRMYYGKWFVSDIEIYMLSDYAWEFDEYGFEEAD